MPLRRNRPNLIKLAGQLERIERSIRKAESDNAYLPSPSEMKALAYMQNKLPYIANKCNALEPLLWQRIKTWGQTPYTPRQQAMRSIAAFVGWWLAATVTILFSIVSWFASLFAEPWHSIVVSAIFALIIVTLTVFRERRSKS